MKILIVTAYFPPQNVVASLRTYSWAKYWGRLGHEIIVYTPLHYGISSNLDTDLQNVKIFEIPIPFIQKFLSSYSIIKEDKNISKKMSIKQRIITLIRNIYTIVSKDTGCILGARYPDIRDIWAQKVIKQVKNSSFDMVITTGCPYSVHRVGLVLKKMSPEIFWVVDWRDLWTQNPLFRGIKIFHWYEKYLEKKFHLRCDVITTVSDGLADDLKTITSTPVEVIYNGFDFEDYVYLLKKVRNRNNRYTLAYLGSIYKGYQNINPLLFAISELDKEGKISPNDLEIFFAGINCNIQDQVEELELEKYYTYLGFIPREQSIEIQYNADAVLFFGIDTNRKGQLSGKIFEYLSLSKEIWSIGMPEKKDVDVLIEKANAGVYLGVDTGKIKSYIMEKISSGGVNFSEKEKNREFISQFERKKQAEKLLSLHSFM